MTLKIDAFMYRYGNKIPPKYTCDGQELSPRLEWDDVPENTQSFAVLMEDLDVPNRSNPLVLWLIYNIPATTRVIETGIIPDGAHVGTNDLGKCHYTGPCPRPSPDNQRYSVQLYALDTVLDLKDCATAPVFFTAAKDHILARVEVIGTYERYKK